jgi:hypothetical protein
MLDAAMCESTELVAMTPCVSNYAASAKGMALDCVRGKTATLRLMLSLLDDLDHVATDGRQRRGFDRRLEEMEAADEAAAAFENEQETNGSVRPVSQGVMEEEQLPGWCEYAGAASGFVASASPPNVSRPATAGRPDETGPEGERGKSLLDGEPQSAGSRVARSKAAHDTEVGGELQRQTAASPPSEGAGHGRRAESERSFLAVARRVPSEKELREQEKQAEIERSRRGYEEAIAHVKAYAAKRGYEFRESQCSGDRPENAPSPLSEGQTQGTIDPHPEEGPNKRALRKRFERLFEAERLEAARKAALAAKAEGSPILRQAAPRAQRGEQAQDEGLDCSPRPEPVEGRGEQTNIREPDPLPDYAIWMRGQRAAP